MFSAFFYEVNDLKKKETIGLAVFFAAVVAVTALLIPIDVQNRLESQYGELAVQAKTDERARYIIDNIDEYPSSILNIYYDNKDNIDFVYNYAFHGNDYQSMSYTDEELNSETVPALYMFDNRWGYETIGGQYIKSGGCAVVALAMAHLAVFHNADADPVTIARLAEENDCLAMLGGVRSRDMGRLAELMGFAVTEHNFEEGGELSEEELRAALDTSGTVVLAAMSGDTFGGHALIIRGYDENGYYINDPADKENTETVWSFDVFKNELIRYYELSV